MLWFTTRSPLIESGIESMDAHVPHAHIYIITTKTNKGHTAIGYKSKT